MGGIEAFVGDGALKEKPERVVGLFYRYNLTSSLWISADYRFIGNPGYNANRGPVNIFSVRAHAEF
ncbi:carbohydrate porin [Candidatus Methylospira mobilis]|uniref:Carbohydrate porin n=1 Tax=Candidatus Methylospira mobilis TaxID=1808979 RepID=A0A5Q0BI36_9GAMM|nr:carbohydrate porin [Candidatus Methylospira mobilis]QFY41827.1 carbohydrate porin [Candidatus Methylospira mobilis]WNV06694.1 carbohydrate porin [Candidatus Methylospira mobilis]